MVAGSAGAMDDIERLQTVLGLLYEFVTVLGGQRGFVFIPAGVIVIVEIAFHFLSFIDYATKIGNFRLCPHAACKSRVLQRDIPAGASTSVTDVIGK